MNLTLILFKLPPMINEDVFQKAKGKFRKHYSREPGVTGYAPGRVEVLGNHTDYNEGYVLSAAIDYGTFFLAHRTPGHTCRVVAGDLMEEQTFALDDPKPNPRASWVNYVMGVAVQLHQREAFSQPFEALFLGNVPLGSGLSSSAALEMSSALALCRLYGLSVPDLDLARMGQRAEHEFAGVRTGLLDQISSLKGKKDCLVLSDFRSLEVKNVPLGSESCFLVCNTKVKHTLVDSAYNERRSSCEEATAFFRKKLDHPVEALRDVSLDEWERFRSDMDPITARRAAHVIGENERVLRGEEALRAGNLEEFGRLMFQSHESSRHNFENSCQELDLLVETSRKFGEVKGARLSGGGFGGSVVVLLCPKDAERIASELVSVYRAECGHACDTMVIKPSDRARAFGPGDSDPNAALPPTTPNTTMPPK